MKFAVGRRQLGTKLLNLHVPCKTRYDILGYLKVVKCCHIKDDVKSVLHTFSADNNIPMNN